MIRFCMIALLGMCCLTVQAEERILSFHSEIAIAVDATMTVSETIRVNAEGDRIRRGIYRDFPTDYRDRYGNRVNVLFEPLDVTRDGEPEKWHAERIGNGMRVYFGDENVYLSSGEHTYVFRYRTARQLGYFDDHDELYWNVTGNGWGFAIDKASARVSLPGDGARRKTKVEGYTGVQGSTARDVTAAVDSDGHALIETRGRLMPEQGLTLVVSFPKGVVLVPDLSRNLQWFATDNRREAVLALGLILLVGFLGLQWRRVGRDPERGVIFPQYDPPPGLSPAAARYVRRMQYDDRCFAADAVELGVRGVWRISADAKSNYAIERMSAAGADLPESARVLDQQLLGSRHSLKLENDQHTIVGPARRAHEKNLQDNFAKANFRRNDGIGCLGGLIGIAAVVAAMLIDPLQPTAREIIPLVAVMILSSLFSGMLSTWIAHRGDGPCGIGTLIVSVVLAALPVAAMWFLAGATSMLFAVLVTLLCGVQVPFARWMRAPTAAGRKLLDQLDGLRLYLGVAERDELARAKAPPMSVDEYQRLLPYALALDVERTWGDRLASAIGPAAMAAAAGSMAWYHGSGNSAFNASSFGSSLGSSLSSAISSSSSPPGSSSGGGGGGSSGGGGGGGGGGGW